jgi:hypothetical protein
MRGTGIYLEPAIFPPSGIYCSGVSAGASWFRDQTLVETVSSEVR